MSDNKVKLIIMGVGGALLAPTKEDSEHIPEDNIKSIKKAIEHGIACCIISGRFGDNSIEIAKKAGMETNFAYAYNGGLLYQNGQLIEQTPLTEHQFNEISKVLKDTDLYTEYYTEEGYHIKEETEKTKEYIGLVGRKPFVSGEKVHTLKNVIEMTTACYDKTKLQELIDHYNAIGDLRVIVYKGTFIEVANVHSQKSEAVKRLAQRLNVDLKNVMVVGDDVNDIPMWDIVGYPVVMGDADEELKAGRIVTDTLANAGLSKAIEKYCFN